MGKIREPWASGFGYGGLAKKIYTRRLNMEYTPKSLAKSKRGGVSDPISRVIELVVDTSLRLPLTGRPEALRALYEMCGKKIEAEFRQWAKANEEIEKLDKDEAIRKRKKQ